MRRDFREAAGLASPTIFTTNPSESLNAALKKKVDYKQHEWPKFNEHLKQLVEGQRDEVIHLYLDKDSTGCVPNTAFRHHPFLNGLR